jgi:hypothetical protein
MNRCATLCLESKSLSGTLSDRRPYGLSVILPENIQSEPKAATGRCDKAQVALADQSVVRLNKIGEHRSLATSRQ